MSWPCKEPGYKQSWYWCSYQNILVSVPQRLTVSVYNVWPNWWQLIVNIHIVTDLHIVTDPADTLALLGYCHYLGSSVILIMRWLFLWWWLTAFHLAFQDPHECPFCLKRFTQVGVRNRHVKSIHLRTLACYCSICKRDFSRPDLLKAHMAVHTRSRAKPPSEG